MVELFFCDVVELQEHRQQLTEEHPSAHSFLIFTIVWCCTQIESQPVKRLLGELLVQTGDLLGCVLFLIQLPELGDLPHLEVEQIYHFSECGQQLHIGGIERVVSLCHTE